jgi:hypothetical protein
MKRGGKLVFVYKSSKSELKIDLLKFFFCLLNLDKRWVEGHEYEWEWRIYLTLLYLLNLIIIIGMEYLCLYIYK